MKTAVTDAPVSNRQSAYTWRRRMSAKAGAYLLAVVKRYSLCSKEFMSVKFYSTAGKRSKHAPPPSESDSEEEKLVTLAAYQTARLYEALTRREDYTRAVQELRLCVVSVYLRAEKSVQASIFQDLLSAVRHCDGSVFQLRALADLISAVEETLPKTRREAVMREHRQTQVDLHRKLRKGLNTGTKRELLELLPEQVLFNIFDCLDPFSLGRASCVCMPWKQLAERNILWSKFIPGYYDMPPGLNCFKYFKGSEQLKLRWHSQRAIINGELTWRSGEITGRSDIREDGHPVTVSTVISSILGRKPWQQSDTSDSDSEAGTSHQRLWRLWQATMTPSGIRPASPA